MLLTPPKIRSSQLRSLDRSPRCTLAFETSVPSAGRLPESPAPKPPAGSGSACAGCSRARAVDECVWGALSGRSGPRPCNPGAAPFLTSCLRAVPRASARKPGRGAGGRGGWRRRATRPQVYANPLRARLPPPLRGPSREKRRPLRGTPPLRSARRPGQRAPGAASGGGTRAASGAARRHRRGPRAGPAGVPGAAMGRRRLPLWLCAVAALLSGVQAKGTPLLARPVPPGVSRYSLYTTGWRPRLRPGPHK